MPGSGLDSCHTDIKRHLSCADQKVQQGNCCRALERVRRGKIHQKEEQDGNIIPEIVTPRGENDLFRPNS